MLSLCCFVYFLKCDSNIWYVVFCKLPKFFLNIIPIIKYCWKVVFLYCLNSVACSCVIILAAWVSREEIEYISFSKDKDMDYRPILLLTRRQNEDFSKGGNPLGTQPWINTQSMFSPWINFEFYVHSTLCAYWETIKSKFIFCKGMQPYSHYMQTSPSLVYTASKGNSFMFLCSNLIISIKIINNSKSRSVEFWQTKYDVNWELIIFVRKILILLFYYAEFHQIQT